MSISVVILGLSIFGIAILYPILAHCLSRTRFPWVIQSLMLVAATVPLLLIDAVDLTAIFLVCSFVVLALSHYHRFRNECVAQNEEKKAPGDRRPRIKLKDLMSVVLLFCVVLALVSGRFDAEPFDDNLPTAHPLRLIGIAFAIGLWSMSGVLLFFGKLGGSLRVLLVLLAMAASLFWAGWADQAVVPIFFPTSQYLNFPNLGNLISKGTWLTCVMLVWLVFLIINGLLVASIAWAFGINSTQLRRRERPPVMLPSGALRRSLRMAIRIVCLSVLSVIVTAMLVSLSYCYVLLWPGSPAARHQDTINDRSLNGIYELIDAGREIAESPILDFAQPVLPGPELKNEIAAYLLAFEKIDAGLSKPNCVWIDWSTGMFHGSEGPSSARFSGMIELRRVAVGLSMRSLQALSDRRFDDVLADGVRCVGVSDAASKDAIYLSSLVSTAVEGIAISIIHSGISNAFQDQLTSTAKMLDALTSRFDSVDDEMIQIRMNEHEYMWRYSGWKDRLYFSLMESNGVDEQIQASLVRRNTYRSLLRTEIAIQLYQLAHQRCPVNLENLVPEFLPQVPIDLYGPAHEPAPLLYVVSESGAEYKLYSVGVNRIDDNGIVDQNSFYFKGDLNLSMIFRDRLKENAEEVAEHLKQLAEQETMYDDDGGFVDDLDGGEMEVVEDEEADNPESK